MSDTKFLEELAEDGSDTSAPQDLLKKISEETLYVKQLTLEKEALELKVKELNDKINNSLEEVIPSLMFEARIKKYQLDDDSVVESKNIIKCSIKSDQKEQALQWLRNNGFPDLIKNDISVSFGKGEEEKANKAEELLKSQGYEVHRSENVHFMTLNAWAKEQLEAGTPPEEDHGFNMFIGVRAAIKEPKKK